MSHIQQSTLAIDKSREDISDVLNELWRQGVLLRLEPEDESITIHCNTSVQMTQATATILAGTPFAVQDDAPEAISSDDVGTVNAADLHPRE